MSVIVTQPISVMILPWLPMLGSDLNGYQFKITARTILQHVKVKIKEIVIIF